MLDEGALRAVLARVSSRTGAIADAFAESKSIAVVECGEQGCSDMQFRARRGIGLRTLSSARVRHVHAPGLSERDLDALGASLAAGEAPPRPVSGDERNGGPPAPSSAAMADAAARAMAALASTDGVTGTCSVRAVRQQVLVADSEGRLARDERAHWSIRVDAIARAGRKVRRSRQMLGSSSLEELVCDDRHVDLAAAAARGAVERLDAVAAPTGRMPVVFAAGRPGALIHEVVGHGLEADHASHPSAAYHGLEGQAVGAACLTVVDDPAPPGQPPLYGVDDEGIPAEATVLIEDGRLRTFLFDRRTALAGGVASNGHGRRLDYRYPALPRTSATYVRPGDSAPAEILADTPNGLLVLAVGGGDTDMGSGRFNLRVEEAYLIEDGRATAPVTGATVSGTAIDVLRAVDRVGDDLEFVNLCFVCNKLEQFPLLISVGQPTLRVAALDVWGDGT